MWEERSASTGSWAATNQGFNGPIGVIMTPTRELALQIGECDARMLRTSFFLLPLYSGAEVW